MILPADQGPQQSDAYFQAQIIKERLRRWNEGEYEEGWKDAVEITKPPKKFKNKLAEQKKLDERNAARAPQVAQE